MDNERAYDAYERPEIEVILLSNENPMMQNSVKETESINDDTREYSW